MSFYAPALLWPQWKKQELTGPWDAATTPHSLLVTLFQRHASWWGNCKKPCSVGYTPISNVNLNHWHIQCLPPLTRNTWIIPPVSNSLWERSGAPVPNKYGFVKLHICKNKPAANDSEWNYDVVLHSTLQKGPLKSETLQLLTYSYVLLPGDLSTGGQVPACKWTVVMLKYANDSNPIA